ncbi:MAG: hypothetical protein OHK0013_08430 [Sandaracinaceae bacterium]
MTMRRARLAAFVGLSVVVATLGLAACGPQLVPLLVRFPSTETFLVTRGVRIRIYDAAEAGGCPALVTAVSGGRDPGSRALYESEGLTACAVRAGLSIPDVGGGARAFLVEGLDRSGNQTILVGCTEAEIFVGGRIEVSVYPTARYQRAYEADMPATGETAESRCGGGS